MVELIQLAPSLAIPLVIVFAAIVLLREIRKMAPNGKFDELAHSFEKLDDRLDDVERKLNYITGKLDSHCDAENTGRHRAITE